MSGVPRVGDLELEQDLDYQRREWRFERIGWAVMAILLLAALLGLFGAGPFSRATATDPDGTLTLEYDRFPHRHAPDTLKFFLTGAATGAGEVCLWLGREYLREVQLEAISPEPEHVEMGEDRHVFVFKVAARGKPTAITFHLKPDRAGPLSGRAGVGEGQPLEFSQFVYP